MAILESSGLYNKHITIINDDSRVISKWQVSLIDDARVIIYDHEMFITEATGFKNSRFKWAKVTIVNDDSDVISKWQV